jgi:hypothetical protein
MNNIIYLLTISWILLTTIKWMEIKKSKKAGRMILTLRDFLL